MHGIEEGLLDKGCAEASDLLYMKHENAPFKVRRFQVVLSHSINQTKF